MCFGDFILLLQMSDFSSGFVYDQKKMAGKMTAAFVAFTVIAFASNFASVESNPAIASSFDQIETCIENCAQCKKMLGRWFEGSLCADSCMKFKGKLIPECEDFASIAPFLINNL